MKTIFLAVMVSASAMLVVAQPTISQGPTNQFATIGGSVVFSVSVSGTGPFSYQWLFDSNNITTMASSRRWREQTVPVFPVTAVWQPVPFIYILAMWRGRLWQLLHCRSQ